MEVTEQVQTPAKKSRSDKGKPRKNPSAGGALSSVLIATQDLNMADAQRVLLAAATFHGIKFIVSNEASNGRHEKA